MAMEKEISLLGVDLVGVKLRPTAEGVIEGVITHASNCTVQTCLLLLLSRSKAAPRAELPLGTNKTGVSSFPSRLLGKETDDTSKEG